MLQASMIQRFLLQLIKCTTLLIFAGNTNPLRISESHLYLLLILKMVLYFHSKTFLLFFPN